MSSETQTHGAERFESLGNASGAATQADIIEWFILLGVVLIVTGLRTYARISTMGLSNLGWDDILVWVALLFYGALTGLVYVIGAVALGLANDSMTPEQRAAVTAGGEEMLIRVLGSKVQLVAWLSYAAVLWCLKGSLCFFFKRLTDGLAGYGPRILCGFILICGSFMCCVLTLFLSCHPLPQMWQVHPDPGDICYAAVSPVLIWVFLSWNIVTDLYLVSVPLPMLFKASIPKTKKVGLMGLFSCGVLIVAAAIVRVVLIVTNSHNGDGAWAIRETFIAMLTTNLAPIIPLLRRWLSPILGGLEPRSDATSKFRTAKSKPTGTRASRVGLHKGSRTLRDFTALSSGDAHIVGDSNGMHMQAFISSPRQCSITSEDLSRAGTVRSKDSEGRNYDGTESPALVIQRHVEISVQEERIGIEHR